MVSTSEVETIKLLYTTLPIGKKQEFTQTTVLRKERKNNDDSIKKGSNVSDSVPCSEHGTNASHGTNQIRWILN